NNRQAQAAAEQLGGGALRVACSLNRVTDQRLGFALIDLEQGGRHAYGLGQSAPRCIQKRGLVGRVRPAQNSADGLWRDARRKTAADDDGVGLKQALIVSFQPRLQLAPGYERALLINHGGLAFPAIAEDQTFAAGS